MFQDCQKEDCLSLKPKLFHFLCETCFSQFDHISTFWHSEIPSFEEDIDEISAESFYLFDIRFYIAWNPVKIPNLFLFVFDRKVLFFYFCLRILFQVFCMQDLQQNYTTILSELGFLTKEMVKAGLTWFIIIFQNVVFFFVTFFENFAT